jgi:hypothetical protein
MSTTASPWKIVPIAAAPRCQNHQLVQDQAKDQMSKLRVLDMPRNAICAVLVE